MSRTIDAYHASSFAQFQADLIDGIPDKIFKILSEANIDIEENERRSWPETVKKINGIIQKLPKQLEISMELLAPISLLRIDIALFGRDGTGKRKIILIEVKGWQAAQKGLNSFTCRTIIDGGLKEVLKPRDQVGQYASYFRERLAACAAPNCQITLVPCCWLFNYPVVQNDLFNLDEDDGSDIPYFFKGDEQKLIDFIYKTFLPSPTSTQKLQQNDCYQVFKQSPEIVPSSVTTQLQSLVTLNTKYTLIDDQLLSYLKILDVLGSADLEKSPHHVFFIKGGPGSGKTVIAITLLVNLLNYKLIKSSKHRKLILPFIKRLAVERNNTPLVFATVPSRAYMNVLLHSLSREHKNNYRSQFRFPSEVRISYGKRDVLVVDEAHRLKSRNDAVDVQTLITSSQVTVFLFDDKQVIRPDECTTNEVRQKARQSNATIYQEMELTAQFRSKGSCAFINAVDNMLYTNKVNSQPMIFEGFPIRVADSASHIRPWVEERRLLGPTRILAGFCWEWRDSKVKDAELTIPVDIRIENEKFQWNVKPESVRGTKHESIAKLWAIEPMASEHVGCIYTAQNLEFDYTAVIIGPDLIYRPNEGWQIQLGRNRDPNFSKLRRRHLANQDTGLTSEEKDKVRTLIRNIYRVLLTRATSGCLIYSVDAVTNKFLKSQFGQSLS